MNASPARIDRYELLAPIGEGGFAAVYRARHVHTGQTVALKVVTDDGTGGVARLLREARAMAEVSNPHVARVFDCGVSEDGRGFVAMELVEGQELRRLIDAGPLPAARAVDIALQLLDGLALVHARGVVHRDVKPSNVFVTTVSEGGAQRDLVKLIDFGISKVRTPTVQSTFTSPGTSMGTPGYMAPEQLGTALEADARADVYGAAATLYEMLSGRLPHEADSYEDFVVKVRTERPPPLGSIAPTVPPVLAEVVDRGLARDRDARWESATRFADALRAAASGASVPPAPRTFQSAPPIGHIEAARTPPPPRPMEASSRAGSGTALGIAIGLLVAFVVVVGAVGVGGYLYLARTREVAAGIGETAGAPATATATATAAASPTATATTPATATATATPASAPATTMAAATASAKAVATGTASASAHQATSAIGAANGGIRVGSPKVVGTADVVAMQKLAARAAPLMGACRKAKADTVRVQLFVQDDGSITIAKADPDNHGDPATAGCVARRFQDATPFEPHGSGIVSFDVTLDPL